MDEYLEKIDRILDNSLEFYGDHELVISNVETWLRCEWQCTEMSAEDFTILLDMIRPLVKAKLKKI